ncbi:hypothetical protein DTL42_18695 [Bremerella cremea]|uniref:MFS transporter n=1 Tax=Bremerella cremea TaxID=1031537 RepID=A0A368KMH3_9BACT|nr:DUF5690 family protein [Bremerella cremea]RCS43526.1 hypothetical protein DTL42_18695 [Bremerella cremea]
MIQLRGSRALHDRLMRASPWVTILFASATSFSVYFCMYAFRKPFTVATYDGLVFGGTGVQLKTALVLGQLFGYALSKYIGIKFCSQLRRENLLVAMLGLIGFAQAALLGFALLPNAWKVAAIFANGLPLGMVWGLAMRYLEGRRATEIMVATLSCSYIFATGAVKDIGHRVLEVGGVDQFWMPFWTGLVFLPPLAVSAWLLDALPQPDLNDQQERSQRSAMTSKDQWSFLAHFSLGLILLSFIYVLLTSFRDFRDNYAADLLHELGLANVPAIFTKVEVVSAITIAFTLAALSFFRHNRHALVATFAIMLTGVVMLGGTTLLFRAQWISGLNWMIFIGLGSYLAYVPYTVLFDRIFAATRASGTSVFAIYLIDSLGYTGSTAIQVYKDLWKAEQSRLEFFQSFSLTLAVVGFVSLWVSGWYFIREERLAREADMLAQPTPGLGNQPAADTTY